MGNFLTRLPATKRKTFPWNWSTLNWFVSRRSFMCHIIGAWSRKIILYWNGNYCIDFWSESDFSFMKRVLCDTLLWKEGQRGDGCGKGTRAVRRAAMSPQRDVTRWGLGSAGAGVMGWGIGDGLQCLSWHIYVQSFGQSMFVFNNKWMHHFGINLFPLLSPDFP